MRERWDNEPGWRLRKLIGHYIWRGLKRGRFSARLEALLGYSAADLRAHLQIQFEPGMSWENYGSWHIDHIRPVASFDIPSVSSPDFRPCWAVENLRPLWAADNLRKRRRVA